MADRSTYEWILGDGLGVACCVTVVVTTDPEDVLRRFGADTTRVLNLEVEADDIESYGQSIAATAVPGGVVAVERNGFQGSREEVLLRVADGGTAASVFWNVESDNAFRAVRAGSVVVDVDMYDFLDVDDPDVLDDLQLPAELLPLCMQAAEANKELWPTGLAMAEAFTGVAIPRAALNDPAALHPLPQR